MNAFLFGCVSGVVGFLAYLAVALISQDFGVAVLAGRDRNCGPGRSLGDGLVMAFLGRTVVWLAATLTLGIIQGVAESVIAGHVLGMWETIPAFLVGVLWVPLTRWWVKPRMRLT